MKGVRACILILMLALCILFIGCSGGGGSSGSTTSTSDTNVQTITVNGGPTSLSYYPQYNTAFTSVKICVPGTSTCQTIDNVMVDTGSVGLRLLSSALTLTLSTETTSSGNQIGECAQFADLSYVWGSVQTADVYLANGNEIAYSVPIHILDPNFPTTNYVVPSDCSSGMSTGEEYTLSTLGANGILGVGSSQYDCSFAGTNYCDSGSQSAAYYTCTSSDCTDTTVSLSQQVQNPVALFSTDNNGVIIELPAVSGPTLSLTGSMVFGIGTQTNNALGSATQFSLDQNGYINTTFNGTVFSSYIDSGSNAYFFQDKNIAQDSNEWYIPSSTLTFSAIIGNNTDVSFSVDNADNMFNDYPNDAVFNTLAGYSNGYFAWGLPFFYGRNVYTSITSQGNGTYWAF
jgi:Protein of unknown function (DUF3443)